MSVQQKSLTFRTRGFRTLWKGYDVALTQKSSLGFERCGLFHYFRRQLLANAAMAASRVAA
jgi:hypothetical protein